MYVRVCECVCVCVCGIKYVVYSLLIKINGSDL